MVRGPGGWLPLPYSRQAKGGGQAICLPPLPGPGPHWPSHGLECPQGWLPPHDGVHEPPVVGLHGRNRPPVRRHVPTREAFKDAWKELVTPLDIRPPVYIPDPAASGRSWPLPSWSRYVQSRPSLVDTIDWTRPLTVIVRGDAYPCAGGSWTRLSIGLLNHGGSHCPDGRPRTLPHRGREGLRPWYPRAEVRCRWGVIPRRHHPLRGGSAPPLPHPPRGRAAPGRGPGGQEKGEKPRPHKQRV